MIKNNIIIYADDTLLMSKLSNIDDSVADCQSMLDKIISWCDKHKLTVNIKKSVCTSTLGIKL